MKNEKEKLVKLANKCSDLAHKHGETEKLFEKLFEKIYKIKYTPDEMDFLVDCIQYGIASMTVESLENGIKYVKKSCNCNVEFLDDDVKSEGDKE